MSEANKHQNNPIVFDVRLLNKCKLAQSGFPVILEVLKTSYSTQKSSLSYANEARQPKPGYKAQLGM